MKFLDEYRNAAIARRLLAEIKRAAIRNWVIMEICGGQTHTIMRYGLDELLPAILNSFTDQGAQCASRRSKPSKRRSNLPPGQK